MAYQVLPIMILGGVNGTSGCHKSVVLKEKGACSVHAVVDHDMVTELIIFTITGIIS